MNSISGSWHQAKELYDSTLAHVGQKITLPINISIHCQDFIHSDIMDTGKVILTHPDLAGDILFGQS